MNVTLPVLQLPPSPTDSNSTLNFSSSADRSSQPDDFGGVFHSTHVKFSRKPTSSSPENAASDGSAQPASGNNSPRAPTHTTSSNASGSTEKVSPGTATKATSVAGNSDKSAGATATSAFAPLNLAQDDDIAQAATVEVTAEVGTPADSVATAETSSATDAAAKAAALAAGGTAGDPLKTDSIGQTTPEIAAVDPLSASSTTTATTAATNSALAAASPQAAAGATADPSAGSAKAGVKNLTATRLPAVRGASAIGSEYADSKSGTGNSDTAGGWTARAPDAIGTSVAGNATLSVATEGGLPNADAIAAGVAAAAANPAAKSFAMTDPSAAQADTADAASGLTTATALSARAITQTERSVARDSSLSDDSSKLDKTAAPTSAAGSDIFALEGGAAASISTTGTNASSDTSAMPTLKVNANVDSSEFPQGLADRVTFMVDHSLNGAKLQVNPAQLGPIELRISVQGDHAQVFMSSHSAVTREALQASTPKLQEMLGQQGFSQVSVDVSQRSFQDRSAYAQQYQYGGVERKPETAAATVGSIKTISRVADGGLDAYA